MVNYSILECWKAANAIYENEPNSLNIFEF